MPRLVPSGRIRFAVVLAAAVLAGLVTCAAPALADAWRHWGPPWQRGSQTFTGSVFASGQGITHSIPGGSEPISQPDDITMLGANVFVAFQNHVGPQGQASPSGNLDSTVVEFDAAGHEVTQWDVAGHADGLTADPELGQVIATVNEDANSSLYLIDPTGGAIQYSYPQPLAHNGGTDAVSIYHGMVLISASAPGTSGAAAPQASYPAVYLATIDQSNRTVSLAPLFYDESPARVANFGGSSPFGSSVTLGLTDPDSNEVVPWWAPRFRGAFMLDSQGDQQQIFVLGAGTPFQQLWALNLSTAINDTAWPLDPSGRLLVTDNADGNVYAVTGPFHPGEMWVAATPCDSNNAPSTCPGPGYPADYLGIENPYTGAITPVSISGATIEPAGLLFVQGFGQEDWR